MKVFEARRKEIRVVTLVIMALYIFTFILSTQSLVARIFINLMTFLAVLATALQAITCIINLADESGCDGSNCIMQGLLLWGVIFVVTLTMF